MPNYDYECLGCGDVFEVFQKMTDSYLEVCPKCNGKVKRLIGSGSGLIFKGSGFYATDYKKSRTKSESGPEIKKECSGCKESTSCPKAQKDSK